MTITAILLISLLVLEMGLRSKYPADIRLSSLAVVHWIRQFISNHRGYQLETDANQVKLSGNQYKSEPRLGLVTMPGVHRIEVRCPSRPDLPSLSTRATVDKLHCRITSPLPDRYEGKPEIWIYGCSLTWGFGLNDNDAFPWILQEKLKDYKIRNFSDNGFGNVHALLQIQNSIEQGLKPVAAVFCYAHFHKERNVAAPSRMRNYSVFNNPELHHPKATLESGGELSIELINMMEHSHGPDQEEGYMFTVTGMTFRKIKRICDESSIIPVLAVQSGELDEPVVNYCEKIGYIISDIASGLQKEEYTLQPMDAHPNRKANEERARRLEADVKNALAA